MDVDLFQRAGSGIHESVRRVRRDYYDAAGSHFSGFVSNCDRSGPFERERNLDVGVRVQRWTLARPGVHDISRNWRAVFFAVKFVRHSDKGQLLKIEKAHF